jgi:hypothetical protein
MRCVEGPADVIPVRRSTAAQSARCGNAGNEKQTNFRRISKTIGVNPRLRNSLEFEVSRPPNINIPLERWNNDVKNSI